MFIFFAIFTGVDIPEVLCVICFAGRVISEDHENHLPTLL